MLIAVGILECVVFWYTSDQPECILSSPPTEDSPSLCASSFLVVMLGVFFLRGNLHMVSPVIWGTAWIFSYSVSHLIQFNIFLLPTEFLGIAFRLDPIGNFMPLLFRIMTVAVALWVYTQLRSAPVVSACVRAGYSNATPRHFVFILGITLIVLVAVPLSIKYSYSTPEAEAKAVKIARTEYGEGYKYHVRGMRQLNGYMWACISAYNEQEIKIVRVEWEQ
ncbi:MAG: hypothetical protein WA919_24910 [Coleofasciculaceae cyanobacterium]